MKINHRYYLTGVLENGDERFLISELSYEAAVKSSQEYLKGGWKFDKIRIWTADGSINKIVEKG